LGSSELGGRKGRMYLLERDIVQERGLYVLNGLLETSRVTKPGNTRSAGRARGPYGVGVVALGEVAAFAGTVQPLTSKQSPAQQLATGVKQVSMPAETVDRKCCRGVLG
jgi:hypothetical protein